MQFNIGNWSIISNGLGISREFRLSILGLNRTQIQVPVPGAEADCLSWILGRAAESGETFLSLTVVVAAVVAVVVNRSPNRTKKCHANTNNVYRWVPLYLNMLNPNSCSIQSLLQTHLGFPQCWCAHFIPNSLNSKREKLNKGFCCHGPHHLFHRARLL